MTTMLMMVLPMMLLIMNVCVTGLYRAFEVIHVAHRRSEINERDHVTRVDLDRVLERLNSINDIVSSHVYVALKEERIGGRLRGNGMQHLCMIVREFLL